MLTRTASEARQAARRYSCICQDYLRGGSGTVPGMVIHQRRSLVILRRDTLLSRTSGKREYLDSSQPLQRRGYSRRNYATRRDTAAVAQRFQDLGLNQALSRQLATSYPHISAPTSAQATLIPAVLAPNDVLLRAHTGTGKSFALFFALLAKPRIVFKSGSYSKKEGTANAAETGISSLLLVPSNELAAQYLSWAHTFLPPSAIASLDSVVQILVRPDGTFIKPPANGSDSLAADMERLRNTPPHVLIATPTRVREILAQPGGSELLGLRTLRTLALDEADALLSLPGRFPARKLTFKGLSPFAASQTHRSPTLEVLDTIMRIRPTHSGGQRLPSAGMEPSKNPRFLDEKRPPESIRRIQHTASERSDDTQVAMGGFAPPLPRTPYNLPLQLICISATANSVLRHFLGARTGWLRTKIREAPVGTQQGHEKTVTGVWLDLTGLSGNEDQPDRPLRKELRAAGKRMSEAEQLLQMGGALPSQLSHSCIVVQPVEDDQSVPQPGSLLPRMRNLDVQLARQAFQQEFAEREDYSSKGSDRGRGVAGSKRDADTSTGRFNRLRSPASATRGSNQLHIRTTMTSAPAEHVLDSALLDALAFCFATDAVARGVAFVPPRWSLRSARARLEKRGVPVVFVGEDLPKALDNESGPYLTLIQATSARGLDLTDLTHVFILGMHAVGDAVRYTHLAGRASRIGHGAPDELPAVEAIGESHVEAEMTSSSTPSLEASFRNPGKVVTLIHDVILDHPYQDDLRLRARSEGIRMGADERRMALMYRRLGARPVPFDLGLAETVADPASKTEASTDVPA